MVVATWHVQYGDIVPCILYMLVAGSRYLEMYAFTLVHILFSGGFLLACWVKEGSVSVLGLEKVTGDTSVGYESQVKLGRTFHPVKIAAVGVCVHVQLVYCTRVYVLHVHEQYVNIIHSAPCNVGTKKEMDGLEKRFLDGEYTPFETAEPSPPESDGQTTSTSKRSYSAGTVYSGTVRDYVVTRKTKKRRKKKARKDTG